MHSCLVQLNNRSNHQQDQKIRFRFIFVIKQLIFKVSMIDQKENSLSKIRVNVRLYIIFRIQLILINTYHKGQMQPEQHQPYHNANQPEQDDESQISISSFEQEEFNRIYTNELKKQEQRGLKKQIRADGQMNEDLSERKEQEKNRNRKNSDDQQGSARSRSRSRQKKQNKNWFIYDVCENLDINDGRVNNMIKNLPVFKKKDEILQCIMNSQVVLITGETGCGKSTQVPRLLYEYIRATEIDAKIICVQPRRLAVKNLHKILSDQIPEKGAVGYHIAMQMYLQEQTKILFMTNGIFLQRLVHSTQFFNQYPFIILDEVHERDIDTDFLLLAIKRIVRNHPKVRIILMSATIDNQLFRYYFADDEIDEFMNRQNHYKKYMKFQEEQIRQNQQFGYTTMRIGQQQKLLEKMQMEFLQSKYPCPTINVTEKVSYSKQYFYLDNLSGFIRREFNMRWGAVCFSHKYPSMHKELHQGAFVIMQEIMDSAPDNRSNEAILIFLPGLAQIETFVSDLGLYFGRRKDNFDIIKCHSSLLNDQVTKKLHHLNRHKIKVIVATNIAESSITVLGVKYVIDFCLSKEVNFDQKSRMENLELVWASKASCRQRAGRTGRVCDGLVFRMVEKSFYNKLSQYSTPEIQRSSLDRLILRIKLIHQNQTSRIFEDPGQVLGTAIQPPSLKHIDEAIKSLIICGGLKVQNDSLILTKLGRIYVDIPLDIIYCRMLIFSLLMGTYEDTLILVCILSQNKNAFRKSVIQKYPIDFYEIITNEERCDFISLVKAYRRKRGDLVNENNRNNRIQLDTYYQSKQLIQDVGRRIKNKKLLGQVIPINSQSQQEYFQKFKITVAYGFLTHLIRVYPMMFDNKQQKRVKMMKKQGIPTKNTVVLLNSNVLKKNPDNNEEADKKLKKLWIQNISQSFRINPLNLEISLGYGISFLHFKNQLDLNKFLFIKFMEKKRNISQAPRSSKANFLTLEQILPHLGDIDYMEEGSTFEHFKEQKIAIDNYSGNRIVGFHSDYDDDGFSKSDNNLPFRLLVTNSIVQQSSRLTCRYSSLLPDIPNMEVILYLMFFPFVVLIPDKKMTRYQSLYLKKRSKLKILYELNNQQIEEANQIRKTIKQLMNLSLLIDEENVDCQQIYQEVLGKGHNKNKNIFQRMDSSRDNRMEEQQALVPSRQILRDPRLPPSQQDQVQIKQETQLVKKKQNVKEKMIKMHEFWPKVKKFIEKQRRPVIGEQKWQEIYFEEKKIKNNSTNVKFHKDDERQFMNSIKTLDLKYSFFCQQIEGQNVQQMTREERLKDYENWKKQKLASIRLIQEKVLDHDPYIVCAQCGVKIAKLNKLGPITNQYYRQVFNHIEENVKEMPFNQLGDYFCSMLMTIYTEKEYSVLSCINEHILAVQFKNEKRLKLLSFSQISILYTDGSIEEQPQFQALEYRKWRVRYEKSKSQKMRKAENNYCFVCNQTTHHMKELEDHVKNQYHEGNVRDFLMTLPKTQRKGLDSKNQNENEGY